MKDIVKVVVIVFFFVCVQAIQAQDFIFEEPLSERIANYAINVKLDNETKTLTGKEVLNWRNLSKDTIRDLQFHLYLNAFKNNTSTFFKERGGAIPDWLLKGIKGNEWGYIDIDNIVDEDGNDLTEGIVFIQPDDNNESDQTVVSIPLEKPILPGQTANFTLEFTSKLPRIIARTGYGSQDYYFVAQWFPKLGVYETKGQRYAQKGQWNCHQFHRNSEFFADFGVYDVEITLPNKLIVGASGSLLKTTENEDNTTTYRYRAEDVIDFTWTASPNFVVKNDRWEHVDIRLLIQPEHIAHMPRYLESAKYTLEYMTQEVGEYPYPTLTIVDPPIYGIRSSGMEYPTLVTGGSFYGMPKGLKTIEIVTVHEVGHQYFMQMLASNEFEEPWLDEGFNTYFENRIMDHYYGEKTSTFNMLGYHIGGTENSRLGYVSMENPKIAENFRPAWGYKHGGYGDITYNKTGTWLVTLERILGEETMSKIMKTYFERWKFKHPCGNDFIDIVNEIVIREHGEEFGPSMDWFFDQVLFSSNLCDYEVHSINNQRIQEPVGFFDQENGEKIYEKPEEKEEPDSLYRSTVVLHRLGEVMMPMEILVHFENGDEVLEKWEGQERSFEFIYERPEKVEWAQIDPQYKIQIDANLNNNSLTLQPKKAPVLKYTSKFMFWVQNLVATLATIV